MPRRRKEDDVLGPVDDLEYSDNEVEPDEEPTESDNDFVDDCLSASSNSTSRYLNSEMDCVISSYRRNPQHEVVPITNIFRNSLSFLNLH